MATAKPIAFKQPSRRARNLALLMALLVVALAAWFWQPLGAYARTGAAYGARMGCACRFVEGRSLADCRKDFEPGMQLVSLSQDDAPAKGVTARFPLLARQTASYTPASGCVLEKWDQ